MQSIDSARISDCFLYSLKRREFITLLGGAAATWPVAARAQQGERVRRIGVLMGLAADSPQSPVLLAGLLQGLQGLGWTVGRNIQIDYRWAAADQERYRTYAAELVALNPDVAFAANASCARALQQASRTVPIVFVGVTDPVGAGVVASLARPGGRVTGVASADFGISAKWLELLKQIAPGLTRVAVLRDPTTTGGIGQLGSVLGVAPSFGVELTPLDVREAGEIERSLEAFARVPHGGLIVTGNASAQLHSDLIIMLAARHRLPALYSKTYYVTHGGLISYGPSDLDQYRLAVGYLDRILKGEKPSDLPVQNPTRYELAINLKTAKALGLTVSPSLLAIADEVIE